MRETKRRFAAVLLAGALGGCTRNPAPQGWLGSARAMLNNPYGAWIVIAPNTGAEIAGEFLAVSADSVFVLRPSNTVVAIARTGVKTARIAVYDAEARDLGILTVAGAGLTISNGAFLIFTMPAWLIAGSVASASQSKAPLHDVGVANTWEQLQMYARFPAGLPANLPRTLPAKRE